MWEREDGSPEPELVFEGTSARVKAGPVLLPLSTILCVRWRGVRFELNTPVDWMATRATITPRRWEFAGADRHVAIQGELWAATDDFVGLHYDNPCAPPTHCLNSKLASARLSIEVKGRPPLHVRSTARAALEIGTTDTTHGVRMHA